MLILGIQINKKKEQKVIYNAIISLILIIANIDPFGYLEAIDAKYLGSTDIIKLESEHKKVYVLGVGEKESIGNLYFVALGLLNFNYLENIKLVNNFIRESSPQNVVVELCDERFNEHYDYVMKHPKFEAIMEKFYNILDNEEKVNKLGQSSDLIELKEMEYLIGIDVCSYRIPQWRSILGDRNWSITQKRLRAKLRLTDILTQEQDLESMHIIDPARIRESQNKVDEIKQELDTSDEDEEEFDFFKVQEEAAKEDWKTDDQIYQEIIIDEINAVILKNVCKSEGPVVNVIMK